MSAPQTIHFHHDTIVERDAVLEPNIVFSSGVRVEKGATIRAFSYLEESRVERDAIVGPYARLRPGSHIGRGSKVGNFVELKATKVGDGAKVNHLSYVGDTDVGEMANVGAGTITCNYDGYNKYRTIIGPGAFIGSHTTLIAPVAVGDNANTAAGSVITEDIPEDALAVGRSRQANLTGKAKMLRARYAKRKAQKKQ
jgi:bifunctional UDP-N-acetylglucosamine pyrophosphorylase/glucosamine-1-phosphate N-acetyltransferase